MPTNYSTISVMKNHKAVLTLRVNYYALPFIESIFLSMHDNGILKYSEDQCIMFLTHKLIQATAVEFLPFDDNNQGDYLYLIHFQNGNPTFSVQHPSESVDDLDFSELLHWVDKTDKLLTSNMVN